MDIELRDWINDEIMPYLPADRVRQGDKIMFRCPICGDSRKSATKKRGYYYLKTASYHCFNCDANLSGMKLLQALSGEDYDDIKGRFFRTMFDGNHFNSLSSMTYSTPEERKTNVLQLKNAIKPEWKSRLSDRAKEYLDGRLVTKAPFLRERFYSYFSKSGGEYIMIPWRINGVDAYFQLNDFLGLSKEGMKYIFPKNVDKLVYGLDNVDMSFPYLICFEGVYDSLFVPNGIAIGGKNLTELQRKILAKRFPEHKIVLALDNDKPGLTATARTLSRNSEPMTLYFKWFGSNTREKDINDAVKSTGNVNMFLDKKLVESMILDSITMKMWLAGNGYDTDGKDKQGWKKGKVQSRPYRNVHSDAPGEVQGQVQARVQVLP